MIFSGKYPQLICQLNQQALIKHLSGQNKLKSIKQLLEIRFLGD